ncbi:MAG: hypothetical protein AAGH43_06025 [Pseudomonadota bacterium]
MPPLSQMISNVEREVDLAFAAGEEFGPAFIQSWLAAMRLWSAEARELETDLAENQALIAKLRKNSSLPPALRGVRMDNIRPAGGRS